MMPELETFVLELELDHIDRIITMNYLLFPQCCNNKQVGYTFPCLIIALPMCTKTLNAVTLKLGIFVLLLL